MLCNSTRFETTDHWPYPTLLDTPPLSSTTAINSRTKPILFPFQKSNWVSWFQSDRWMRHFQRFPAAVSTQPRTWGRCGALSRHVVPVSGYSNQETWHLLSIGAITFPSYLSSPDTHTDTHTPSLLPTHYSFTAFISLHYLEWACLVWLCAGRLLGDPVAV